ncbi:MAG: protein-S-isoprenylcysteine O-methyltransferase [Cyanobacteria bacterium P01_F01_bin.86]
MNKALKIVFPLIAVVIAAVIVWRLPMNGWGSLVWLAGAIAMGVIRKPHERINKENEITESRQTTVENVLLTAVSIGSALLPILCLTLGLFRFADYNSLPTWATAGGVVLLVVGLWLFWRSHADLGRNWSVTLEIRESHDLVTSGVYERIRHPMYSAIFLIVMAQTLLLHNWIAGFSGIVAFGLMYVIRVPREEAMMREYFGEKYDAYCQNTGRVYPKLIR